jgi:DNA-directed RNA polymerase subunit RPC12/RpoP
MLIQTDNNPTNLGYFMVDQRATGLPTSAGTPLFETATYTCTHCERVVLLNSARKRPRYKCHGCNHLICDDCAAEKLSLYSGRCVTYKQKLDAIITHELAAASLQPTPPETQQTGVETHTLLLNP